jgi:peptidoglycan L-alanyl-D-glutamate endopeptidase CwlK
MGYKFGRSSEQRLKGVHPDLIAVNRRAIQLTDQDYTIFEGVRKLERQQEYVRRGVSWTMDSKHLKQATGYGHATDNVPWIDGAPRWELQPCCAIAEAMRQAAEELNIKIRWGGCWEVLNGTTLDPYKMVEAYTARKRSQGRRASVDGPHFELFGY